MAKACELECLDLKLSCFFIVNLQRKGWYSGDQDGGVLVWWIRGMEICGLFIYLFCLDLEEDGRKKS